MAPKKMIVPKPDIEIKVDSSDIDKQPKIVKKTVPIIKKKQMSPVGDINKEKQTEEKSETEKQKNIKKVQIKEQAIEKLQQDEQTDIKDETKDEIGNKEILIDASKLLKTKKHSTKKLESNISSNDLFNNEDVDYRNILMNYDFTKNRTPAKITKYEKALLIGKRAKQIEEGANPNVKVLPGQSAIEIAEEELRLRNMPLIIKRPLGNTFEYWRPRDMEVLMD
jgi:DNA-directed RNA polymerase subunit K/omega